LSTDLSSPAPRPLILASGSVTRLQMLRAAGLDVTAQPARVDEDTLRDALLAEGATPQDLADALAEMKARKVADKSPTALVLGCDQILALKTRIFTKPATLDEAAQQLRDLSAQTHHLHAAAVLYDAGQPIWRRVTTARMTMRPLSEAFIAGYLSRNWPAISTSVGAYQIENEGIRLFSTVEGDYFTILGLPLMPLIDYLITRGFLPS
jgi:septum formation protein